MKENSFRQENRKPEVYRRSSTYRNQAYQTVASGDQARRMEELWEDISFGLSKLRPIAAVPLSEFSILLRPLERTKE
ncbi:hypothetical protein ES288_D13G022100v1 [Gossypium darwinii]|uniref:Uncharacterized protein n=1 Tax=Gossypium darwinii TaxID=34276 RepID=A0A5D1ZVX6_GOSDA|nr:hypothetical protein ES288_D13G022100v1 [Gossypium darwinii]